MPMRKLRGSDNFARNLPAKLSEPSINQSRGERF